MSGGTGSVNDCPELQRTGMSEEGRHVAASAENSRAGTAYQEFPLESILEFRPLPTAVSCGRLHARNVLFEWHLTGLTDDAELIVSELLTNAYSASRPEGQFHDLTPITLRLRANSQFLIIEVWDRCPDDPHAKAQDTESDTGRGLTNVEALAKRRGYARTAAYRKVVWAELLVPAPAESFLNSAWHHAQRRRRTRAGP
jgi:anti-sigma regulatory factor (Ser/Thr protein kinase)